MKTTLFILISTGLVLAQPAPDRLLTALQDRALVSQASRLGTDQRITFYQDLAKSRPENLHYQVLLSGAYIQKMRETTDFGYVDRAAKILDKIVTADPGNYEALRLQTEIALERHNFTKAADFSKRLTQLAPQDPFNWGTLGDAYIELGAYDQAAEAYQTMMNLRPDLSSYNRAAHYRFLTNDMQGAIRVMKLAIDAGSASPENIAWCQVELGNYYFKTGQLDQAAQTYGAAIHTFPNYHPSYAALGKLQAEQGNVSAAVKNYLRAQSITPLPDYAAALHDLYLRSGKTAEANQQMATVDAIDTLGKANNEKANRNLALIYADHDRKLDRALELARAELQFRQDIYTYDALAWALYKNQRYAEAAIAMEKALKLNTPEPAFKMHAAKIKEAAAQTALERMENSKLTAAQRNDACFELRGRQDAAVLDSMLRALHDERVRACAGTNLRKAGAKARLQEALADPSPEVRAQAARELGSFADPAMVEDLAKAAADPNLLVATNGVSALCQYPSPDVLPYLEKIARKGGIAGGLAFDRIADLKAPEALVIARELLRSSEPGDEIAAMRVVGESGDASDLARLREIAAMKDAISVRQRGFGLMPALDLSRAAQATISQIERHGSR